MKYKVEIKGFEGQNIEVQTGVFSSPKLFVDGVPVPVDKKTDRMILQHKDGTQYRCKWNQRSFGLDVPALEVEGIPVQVVSPLHWATWVWCVLPVLMLFIGGAIGAFIGIIGAGVNIIIFRTGMKTYLKFILTAAVLILVVVNWLFILMLIQTAIS